MTNDDSGNLISFKWNNHQTTFFEVLADLRAKDIYTDVTLACEHQFVSAHKLVLSSCSEYFKEIFARAACISPVIVLKDVRITELDALIDYMYLGEADVKESDVNGVLRAAECLKIKGLGVPDEHSKYFSSPATSSVETEFASPNKKIKLEDKNDEVKSEPQHKKKQLLSPAGKEEKKRKGTQDNFPLLINALKAAKVARRSSNSIKFTKPQFRNHALKNNNSTRVKSNREIKVIALPSSGKKVDLMTVQMNEEVTDYNDSKQLSTDSTINHSSNSLSALHEENDSNIIYPVIMEDKNDSVSDCHTLSSQFKTALPQKDDTSHLENSANSSYEITVPKTYSQLNMINKQQRELSDVSTEAKDMEMSDGQNAVKQDIMEEDESEKLKLPNFSPMVQPYLNGETLSHKTLCRLRKCIVDQLISHFSNFEEQIRKVPSIYSCLENLLVQTYPNIVEDKCKRRSGHLGSLIYLMRSKYKKATKDIYKFIE